MPVYRVNFACACRSYLGLFCLWRGSWIAKIQFGTSISLPPVSASRSVFKMFHV